MVTRFFAYGLFIVAALGLVACESLDSELVQEESSITTQEQEIRGGRRDCPRGRDVHYISRRPSECADIRFTCETGYLPFNDRCGCGCVVDPNPEPIFCGGIAGIPCPDGLTCIDNPTDSCDPDCGGADCGGFCVEVEGSFCGGIAGFQCPDGYQCFDDTGDSCSPLCGGADCAGFCAAIR